MKILVDADSCPVEPEIIKLAAQYNLKTVMVASLAHFSAVEPENDTGLVEEIITDSEPQATDMAIINAASEGDIVVTDDYGLASLAIAKRAYAISFRGHIFSEKNIDQLLEKRFISMKQRRHGNRTKGPKAITKAMKARFMENLKKLIEKAKI